MMMVKWLLFGVLALAAVQQGEACTNMLVSAGATVDGTTHIAYNADDGGPTAPLVTTRQPTTHQAASAKYGTGWTSDLPEVPTRTTSLATPMNRA